MPSFDITSKANLENIKNAVDVTMKMIVNRYDFKGTSAKVGLNESVKGGLSLSLKPLWFKPLQLKPLWGHSASGTSCFLCRLRPRRSEEDTGPPFFFFGKPPLL